MNDFQIISKLGEGAYSTVFKVRRNIDNKIYALKKVKLLNLSEKEKENSLNEVRILASVKSNFVVSYKEAFFDEKDNTLCIIMEFADRGDLYQKIVQHKKSAILFEESDIWRIFIQLVKGLKSLHDLKILHRDMKSANVFLFSNGSAKLGDLNVSKVAKRGLGYTQTGTPYYASPEVWKDKPYDNKSDVWSLGCVLYEMITLRPPFRAQNMEGLYNKVCKGQFSRIPDKFSDDLYKVVQFLLQVNPISRPSCEQILNHPIIQKRIEYFKSFAGDDDTEDKCLLKTIHMPKNLLFLSDKLPKPNYDKQFKSSNNNVINVEESHNYRSFNRGKNNENQNNNIKDQIENKDFNKGIHIKKQIKLSPLPNIPEEKRMLKLNSNLIENNKQEILRVGLSNSHSTNNINNTNIRSQERNNSLNNNNQSNIIVNKSSGNNNSVLNNKIKLKKDEMYYLDFLSKQKNDLKKLMLKNNNININRKIVYHNNSQINSSPIKDINKMFILNMNNKSAPKKVNNRILKNKYYIQSPPYMKGIERYHENINKLGYDYRNNYNNINNNNIRLIYKEGPENKVVPKIPRRLSPIKKGLSNII
jgi:NIMA (never in mitosis gene a)-related kinase